MFDFTITSDKKLLKQILKLLTTMNQDLQQIKADLQESKDKLAKVATDVTNLHNKIDQITGELPTAEEWAEVKTLASDLKTGLTTVDEVTPDE